MPVPGSRGSCAGARLGRSSLGASRAGGAAGLEHLAFLAEQDFALVTNNARDFLALFGRLELHNGLVILLPSVPGREQVRLFNLVLDTIQPLPDLVNRLVTVDLHGRVEVRDWPGTPTTA